MRFKILLLIVLLSASVGYTQVYPVQGSASLIPPYALRLSDYATSTSDRMVMNVLLADVTKAELHVRFRISIVGQNVKLETKPEYIGSPITLQGGIPLRLTNIELAEYFDPNHLNFSGISKNDFLKTGFLPEGFYQFCFEVYEYNRGVKISNTICAPAWLILNDPPLINLPMNGSKLKPLSPQNAILQWTPRHTGSPNAAFTTEYEVKVVEVWPANRNPNDAILTQPTIYEATTNSTTLVYGPDATQLEPGRTYAFRVQAKAVTAAEQLDLFKNNGYSETVSFVYGDACDPPLNIVAQAETPSRITLQWDAATSQTGYTVQYRVKGQADANWYSATSLLPSAEISGLQPNTTYEYEVMSTCGSFESTFGNVATITTPDISKQGYVCGVAPGDFNLDPSQLLPILKVGDIVNAGDFDVTITKVSGADGVFTGEGAVVVPFLNQVKGKVAFENITVNNDKRMVNGFMNITGGGVEIVPSSVLNAMDQLSQALNIADSALNLARQYVTPAPDPNTFVADTLITVAGGINKVYKDVATGNIIVVDNSGKATAIPPGKDIALVDNNGKGVIVNKQGGVTSTTAALAAASAKREYNLSLTFAKAPDSKLGFDEQKLDPLKSNFEKLSEAYFVSWKAVTTKSVDAVQATYNGKGLDPSKIKFEQDGNVITPAVSGNTFSLSVNAVTEETPSSIIAKTTGTDGKEQILGKLNVVGYADKPMKLQIVKVNNANFTADAAAVKLQLDQVYAQTNVTWDVTVASQTLQVSGLANPFDDGGSGLLSNYTGDMKTVINAAGELLDDTYYLFLIDQPASGNKLGYMPRSKRAGFIFTGPHGNDVARMITTMAHELGHGAFTLKHTFAEYTSIPQGSTDNLMDYNNGTQLWKYQWDQVHNPAIVLGLFESDEAGAYETWTKLEGDVISQIPGFENKEKSFLSPTGMIITLPANSRDFTFANGYLTKFTIDNKRFISLNTSSSKKFKGYFFDVPESSVGAFDISKAQPYEAQPSTTKPIAIFYVLKDAATCGNFKIYTATYKSTISNDLNGGIGQTVDLNKIITNLDQILEDHKYVGEVSERINCLNGRAKELYKFFVDHYEANQHPLTAEQQDALIDNLDLYSKVFVSGLDSVPGAVSKRIKVREMLSYGVTEFLEKITELSKEIASPTVLIVEFEDLERFRDAYLFYQISKKLDPDCALAEKLQEEIDRQISNTGEVEFNLAFFSAVGKASYEIISGNETFELLNCLLKNLRAPESLYNPNRLDYKFQGFIKELFERYIKIDKNGLTAKIATGSIQYPFACDCGVWNSLVDLVYGLTELGSGVTQDPIALAKKTGEFFTAISSGDGLGQMGSGVWEMFKEHHGYADGYGFDSYQATYGGCYDIVFVASFFVGIGELKAISAAGDLGEIGRILAKSAKAYPATIKQIVNWTATLSNKAARNLVLELFDKLPPGLYIQLPSDVKAIHVATALNEGIRLATLSNEGILITTKITASVGRSKEIVYRSSIVIKDVETGTTGALTIVKLEDGKYAGFIDNLLVSAGEWYAFLDKIGNGWDDALIAAFKVEVESNSALKSLFTATALTDASKTDLANAWKIVKEEIRVVSGTSQFAKDPSTLRRIAAYLSPSGSSKLNAIGGEQGLRNFIAKHPDVPCVTCGTGGQSVFAGRRMDEMIENFVEVGYNFRNNQTLWNKLKVGTESANAAMREGIQHVLETFKNNPVKYSPDNIQDLDMKFEELVDGIDLCNNCRYDVKFKDNLGVDYPRLEEFKSYGKDTWNSISTSDKFVNQFKAYLGSGEITRIKDLAYVINTRKAMASDVRNAFKVLFESKKDDIFDVIVNNQNLRNNLFTNADQVGAYAEFEQMISNKNSKLYEFIVEK